jgi:hypothetical protein
MIPSFRSPNAIDDISRGLIEFISSGGHVQIVNHLPRGGPWPEIHGASMQIYNKHNCVALAVFRQLAVIASIEALDPVALRCRLSTSLPLSEKQ